MESIDFVYNLLYLIYFYRKKRNAKSCYRLCFTSAGASMHQSDLRENVGDKSSTISLKRSQFIHDNLGCYFKYSHSAINCCLSRHINGARGYVAAGDLVSMEPDHTVISVAEHQVTVDGEHAIIHVEGDATTVDLELVSR